MNISKYGPRWYRRDGTPFKLPDLKKDRNGWLKEMEKMEKLYQNPEYKIVKQQRLWNGFFVSTVWLGLDHSHDYFSKHPVPIIFETMVFPAEWSGDMDRYATEEQAKAGHEAMVRKWNNPFYVIRYLIDYHLYIPRLRLKKWIYKMKRKYANH